MSSNVGDTPEKNIDFIDGLQALNNIDGLLSDYELIKKFAQHRRHRAVQHGSGMNKHYKYNSEHSIRNNYKFPKLPPCLKKSQQNNIFPKLPRQLSKE